MNELNTNELEMIAGGGSEARVVMYLVRIGYELGKGLYNAGMNAHSAGLGDEFLGALNGGNLGA